MTSPAPATDSHDPAGQVSDPRVPDPRSADPRVSHRQVATPDGRVLAVAVAGTAGPLVVVHHGTPGCGLLLPGVVDSALARGVRVAAPTRAGYAGSDRLAGRSVADAAADAAAVADALGADTFTTWGTSGGGPHALATAALLGDRVVAVAVLAGVAPFDAGGLDWLAGMGADNLAEFAAARTGEQAVREFVTGARAEMLAGGTDELVAAMASLLPAVDADVLRGPDGPAVGAWVTGGLAGAEPGRPGGGVDGWVDDDLAFVRDWGFDPAALTCPVLLLQGAADLMVPPAHVRWLARHTGPAVELRELPGDGHLSLLARVDEVHGWLLDHRDGGPA